MDDSTKYYYMYLLKSKDEAIEKFVLYKNEVENQLNKKVKVLRSDRGGEYESPYVDFCPQPGIIHETTTPYSPQSNGVAERKNCTLKEMMNAMLISSGQPQNMWGEAILSANYLLHKCLSFLMYRLNHSILTPLLEPYNSPIEEPKFDLVV